MKIISFEDGQMGEVWETWRKSGIGASDIGSVMGSNPYMDELKLWRHKNSFIDEPTLSYPMKHGMLNEDKVRNWVNKSMGLNLKSVCIEHDDYNFFKASLDGYDKAKSIIYEIKCPLSKETLNNVREEGIVPEHWAHQVQWQMFVSGLSKAFLVVYDSRKNRYTRVKVEPNEELQKEMEKKAKLFWENVCLGIQPKQDTSVPF